MNYLLQYFLMKTMLSGQCVLWCYTFTVILFSYDVFNNPQSVQISAVLIVFIGCNL